MTSAPIIGESFGRGLGGVWERCARAFLPFDLETWDRSYLLGQWFSTPKASRTSYNHMKLPEPCTIINYGLNIELSSMW